MAGKVIIDTSPLIGLSTVNGISWLKTLFGTVWIPQIVEYELFANQFERGKQDVKKGITQGWVKIYDQPLVLDQEYNLDQGEIACIALGLKESNSLIIMDERLGRSVAIEKGLKVAGTAAIIGLAKQKKLIPSAKEVFRQLHHSDFRIAAEVINQVLAKVGE